MFGKIRFTQFFIAVAAVLLATAVICVSAVSCGAQKLKFETEYYFVCYAITDNSVSASSISGAVSSYGGAGYILRNNGDYFVTVACYYSQGDADVICESLKKRELNCTVLKIQTKDYPLKTYYAKNNAELFLGNLNTLNSLSLLAYECANGLDTGGFSQERAKNVVADIKSGIDGLMKANGANCFRDTLYYLSAECKDKENGFLLSKDMRYLQIAIADAVINAELY